MACVDDNDFCEMINTFMYRTLRLVLYNSMSARHFQCRESLPS